MKMTRYKGPITQCSLHSHGLNAQGFATDEALASFLDRCPDELIDINLYDYDEEGQFSLRTGTRGALDGAGLLEAIHAGRLWVNVRHIETVWPQMWEAASKDFYAIQANFPGLKAVKRSGQLILSSPKARVPYHFDAAGVVLFHMRGRKRLFVYPGDEAHLPERSMELVVARQTTEEIPYSRAFEADAYQVDLEEGQALLWPLYAPHRVENLDRFCVSLSMDFQTWSTRWRNGALYSHAVGRHLGLKLPTTDNVSLLGLWARWALSLGLKRTKLLTNQIASIPREFEVEASAPDGARVLGR